MELMQVTGPVSLLLFLFGLVLAILAAVRAALVRRVKNCKGCKGYGIIRCRLCDGQGKVSAVLCVTFRYTELHDTMSRYRLLFTK